MLHAFQASKKALTDATYLAHPLPGASLSLAVDASATHVGAGLHQRRQGAAGLLFQEVGAGADQILRFRQGAPRLRHQHTPLPLYAGGAAVCPADRPQAAHLRPGADFGAVDG
jgi:hypothetical protein